MASNSIIEIERFNGQNFELWKIEMEDLLVDREKWAGQESVQVPSR
jgi:hypothetical protein